MESNFFRLRVPVLRVAGLSGSLIHVNFLSTPNMVGVRTVLAWGLPILLAQENSNPSLRKLILTRRLIPRFWMGKSLTVRVAMVRGLMRCHGALGGEATQWVI